MAKIAFLSFYSGLVDRGVETFLFEITHRLSKTHNITIFQAGQKIKNNSIRTYTYNSFATKPRKSSNPFAKIYLDLQSLKILLFTLKTILRLIQNRYDVIIPLNGGWQTPVVRIISKLTNSKVLISGHAGIGADDAWNLFFRPDIFIALTTSEKLWAKNICPEMRIEIIPNGVDLTKFNPQVKARDIDLPKPIIICAAALEPYKKIETTIRAAAKNGMSLLVLGDGQLKGQIDALGKRLLGKNYKRIVASYEEMPAYYKAGSVFTLVSSTEAFGIAYIEAMACNLPVVASNDQSRSEIIENAGILTNPNDINQYAADLKIAANTNYRNIPYNQALKFSWNKIAKKYSDLLNNI